MTDDTQQRHDQWQADHARASQVTPPAIAPSAAQIIDAGIAADAAVLAQVIAHTDGTTTEEGS
jgi:hypothetical protein